MISPLERTVQNHFFYGFRPRMHRVQVSPEIIPVPSTWLALWVHRCAKTQGCFPQALPWDLAQEIES